MTEDATLSDFLDPETDESDERAPDPETAAPSEEVGASPESDGGTDETPLESSEAGTDASAEADAGAAGTDRGGVDDAADRSDAGGASDPGDATGPADHRGADDADADRKPGEPPTGAAGVGDAGPEATECSTDEPVPPASVDAPTITYAWGEYVCDRCGEPSDRVWTDDGAFVCPECKRW